jgi:hypothetical protein
MAIADVDVVAASILAMFTEERYGAGINLTSGFAALMGSAFSKEDLKNLLRNEVPTDGETAASDPGERNGQRVVTWQATRESETSLTVELRTATHFELAEPSPRTNNWITRITIDKSNRAITDVAFQNQLETNTEIVPGSVAAQALTYWQQVAESDTSGIRERWHQDFVARIGDARDITATIERSYGIDSQWSQRGKQIRLYSPIKLSVADSRDYEFVYVVPTAMVTHGYPADVTSESLLVLAPEADATVLRAFDSHCWTMEDLAKVFPGIDLWGETDDLITSEPFAVLYQRSH